ncbi:MAG: transglutaminase [Flavobacteriaceae bacterium]|nr:transglutaminase [Flavobacteriaceae bacterium]|tara:strand:+ start:35775 stop:36398 length:624 start_codon:yes stop_codon:yes gene_type:complete
MKFLQSKNRLEALSDGVFAFAATLMVVDIGRTTELLSLQEGLPNFISFAASFFIMMALWKVHYNFFRRTNYLDDLIIALNMIFLFTVLFYIFPVKGLLDSALRQSEITIDSFSQLFQIYSIGFAMMFGSFSLMYFRAYKKDKEIENPYVLLFYTRHFLIYVFVGLFSALLANLQIGLRYGVPGFIYAILGVLCYWHSVEFQKKHSLD